MLICCSIVRSIFKLNVKIRIDGSKAYFNSTSTDQTSKKPKITKIYGLFRKAGDSNLIISEHGVFKIVDIPKNILNNDVIVASALKDGDSIKSPKFIRFIKKNRFTVGKIIENNIFRISDTGITIPISNKIKLKKYENIFNQEIVVELSNKRKLVDSIVNEFPNDIQKLSVQLGLETNPTDRINKDLDKLKCTDFEEIKNRTSFLDHFTFSVDSKHSIDFDDAISYKYIDENSFQFGVHITDVTHHLDRFPYLLKNIMLRGSSFYENNLRVPLIPNENLIKTCSLIPGYRRATISTIYTVKNNTITSVHTCRGYILSSCNYSFEWLDSAINYFQNNDSETFLKKYSEIDHKAVDCLLKIFSFIRIYYDYHMNDSPTCNIFDNYEFYSYSELNPKFDSSNLVSVLMAATNHQIAKLLHSNNLDYITKRTITMYQNSSPSIDSDSSINSQDSILNQEITLYAKSYRFSRLRNVYTQFTSPLRRFIDIIVHYLLLEHLENKKIPTSVQRYLHIILSIYNARVISNHLRMMALKNGDIFKKDIRCKIIVPSKNIFSFRKKDLDANSNSQTDVIIEKSPHLLPFKDSHSSIESKKKEIKYYDKTYIGEIVDGRCFIKELNNSFPIKYQNAYGPAEAPPTALYEVVLFSLNPRSNNFSAIALKTLKKEAT